MTEAEVYEGETVTAVGYLGKKLAIGTQDDLLLCDKKKPSILLTHKNAQFQFVAASPDGSRFATNYGRRGVLVDVASREVTQSWNVKGEGHGSFAMSSDGNRMAAMGSDEGGSGVVLEVGTEKPVARFGGQRYGTVVFLDSKRFACAACHGQRLSTLSVYELAGKKALELKFGQFKERVFRLATLGGALFGATDAGIVQFQLEKQMDYNSKAPTKLLLAGTADDLDVYGDDLVAATPEGVFLVEPATKKVTQVSKRSATSVGVGPRSIAFIHDTGSGHRKVFELKR